MINHIKMNVPLFAQSKDSIWLAPHLAPQMLLAHLANDFDGATRNSDYVN